MSSTVHISVSKKAEIIKRMFASIAQRYDLLNTLLSGGIDACWRKQTAGMVALPPASLVLDLCTGTGKLAEELGRRFPDAQVMGVDFCFQMLRLARNRRNPSFPLLCADALCLPFRPCSCDLVAVAFGIRNFTDLSAGLAEIYRCLKPSGAAVCLEFFLPPKGAFAALYKFYLARIIPFLGEKISGCPGAYSYLRDSIASFPSPTHLSQMMGKAGFQRVSYKPLTGGVVAIHQGWKAG